MNSEHQKKLGDQIWGVVKGAFEKVLGEELPENETKIEVAWRPNNYRRKIKVRQKTDDIIESIKNNSKSFSYTEHTKLLFVDVHPQVKIQYGRETLTAMYSQRIINGEKEVFLIRGKTVQDIETWILSKVQEIEKLLDAELKKFIKKHDLRGKYTRLEKPKWDRYEDMILGEAFIDSLPEDLIFNTSHVKKVYPKGVEFVSKEKDPGVQAVNYIKNASWKEYAPEIADEIEQLRPQIERLHEFMSLSFRTVMKKEDLQEIESPDGLVQLQEPSFESEDTIDFEEESFQAYKYLSKTIKSYDEALMHRDKISVLLPHHNFALLIDLLKKRVFGEPLQSDMDLDELKRRVFGR